ncbi:MAG: HAD-IIIC family phosphatase [Lachnospiraceae bacterium]|nr:HAD-IIIC family phosphatase [Lachnospiraceae bacterium]
MLRELEYPFDNEYILKKSKSLKKALLKEQTKRIQKKIAVLGGSTTHDISKVLELFLLNYGIEPVFYESEYAQYWQDVMFNEELQDFAPDIIYIHTSNRNIHEYPKVSDSPADVDGLLTQTYSHFETMWQRIEQVYHCPVIQNNMELPFYRLLGNRDASDIHGRIHFINQLNEKFYQYANAHQNFYINDIQYLSSCYGLDKWSDPLFWHMYKYALCLPAIPNLSYNVANIIKAIYGKNKKSLVLDLDNTLWGGIVGDDGVENLEIGQETSMGQVFSEFQQYVKDQKDIGVMLNISSKNEEENAIAGLEHPDAPLKPEDFILIKANWDPKSMNIQNIAKELNILPESLVFVDDNPAEREIVRQQVPGVSIPEIGSPEQYISVLDHSGFFEVTQLSEDDRKRNEMYKANVQRHQQEAGFADYSEYLRSLDMKGTIKAFEPMYMARIAQLTNKSNQFNLTTKRFSQSEIQEAAADAQKLTLYGKLEDKFGDNGVVSIVMGDERQTGEMRAVWGDESEEKTLHIELWLMSCRVLKRDMEFAMMDALVEECRKRGITKIKGYYYPTAKNAMVREFYGLQGFTKEKEDENGNTVWYYKIENSYEHKNKVIQVNSESQR